MSTNSTVAWTTFCGCTMSASFPSRSSGTGTMAVLGSMVQKGKFSAFAFWARVSALKRVDLPTLGSPTMPMFSAIAGFLYGPSMIPSVPGLFNGFLHFAPLPRRAEIDFQRRIWYIRRR